MLSENLSDRSVNVTVVNRSPKAVVERLTYLGLDAESIKSVEGPRPVMDFIDEMEEKVAGRLVASLANEDDLDCSLAVAGGEAQGAAVIRITPTGSDVELLIESLATLNTATRA